MEGKGQEFGPDLLAYVVAGGNPRHKVFQGGH